MGERERNIHDGLINNDDIARQAADMIFEGRAEVQMGTIEFAGTKSPFVKSRPVSNPIDDWRRIVLDDRNQPMGG